MLSWTYEAALIRCFTRTTFFTSDQLFLDSYSLFKKQTIIMDIRFVLHLANSKKII